MDEGDSDILERRPRSRTLNGDTPGTESASEIRRSISKESASEIRRSISNDESDESDVDGEVLNRRRHPILKRSRSVPVSPNRKNVHFADGFGIPLVSVRKYFEQQESDFLSARSWSTHANLKPLTPAALKIKWNLCFQQPVSEDNFMDRVMSSNVCLENLVVTQLTLLGTVKVKNLGYHKEVVVRYTLDGWKTYRDVFSSYVSNSCDVTTDRFSFGIRAPENLIKGSRLEFAVCFRVSGSEFWDNNYGRNYAANCVEI